MAYEYLNTCTDRMFENLAKTKDDWGAFQTMLPFYYTVLKQGKFKAQRWYFQRKIFEWNPASGYGMFLKHKRELGGSALQLMNEYEEKRKQQSNSFYE